MQHKRLTSILLIVALGASVLFAQDPNQIPPSVEKYRKERVGPLSGSQPDPEETARMQAIGEHKRKHEAMKELRRTGQTSLTQAEIDDFLDAGGIKRGMKLDNVPVCLPGMPVRPCGRDGVWMVFLQPFVRIADVDLTIQALEARYGVQKKPEYKVDAESPYGAYLVISGTDAQAIALSRDPLVRLVGRDRYVTIEFFDHERKRPTQPIQPATPINPAKPSTPGKPVKKAAPKAIKKTAFQGTYYQLDRIDQRDLPLDGQYVAPNIGAGTDIYHVGGHPWAGHIEFTSPPGVNRTFTTFIYYTPPIVDGCAFAYYLPSQHDTSVLSSAASRTFGVAPGANLVVYAAFKTGG